MTIEESVIQIVCEQLLIDAEDVNYNSKLADLEADSLDIIEIVMDVEDEFEISIPDEDFEKLDSIFNIIEYIKNAKSSKSNSNDLCLGMIGALIGYDALPYQLATSDHDRLEKRYVDGSSYYKLDEKAAKDFVSFWKGKLNDKY